MAYSVWFRLELGTVAKVDTITLPELLSSLLIDIFIQREVRVQTERYDYSPIIRRKRLQWPNNARIALLVAPNIEFFHVDKVIPGAAITQLPDVTGYALRDYGSRIGVFRMMEVLDKYGIRATV